MAYGLTGRIRCTSHPGIRFNEAISVLEIDPRVDISDWINDIEGQVYNRIFIRGLNSRDDQMKRRKALHPGDNQRFLYYRVYTKSLSGSLRVEQEDNFLWLIFRRKTVILDCLTTRYGTIFEWSPSDIAFVERIVRFELEYAGWDPYDMIPARLV